MHVYTTHTCSIYYTVAESIQGRTSIFIYIMDYGRIFIIEYNIPSCDLYNYNTYTCTMIHFLYMYN